MLRKLLKKSLIGTLSVLIFLTGFLGCEILNNNEVLAEDNSVVSDVQPLWDIAKKNVEGKENYYYVSKDPAKPDVFITSIPDDIKNLIKQVKTSVSEASGEYTYESAVKSVGDNAHSKTGILSENLYNRFFPAGNPDGSVTYHYNKFIDINFAPSPKKDGTFIATLQNCVGGEGHSTEPSRYWAGTINPWLMFCGITSELNFAEDINFNIVPSAIFANFYSLQKINWPMDNGKCKIQEVSSNAFMNTKVSDANGVLELPEGIQIIGDYAFAHYNGEYGRDVKIAYIPSTITKLNEFSFTNAAANVKVFGYADITSDIVKDFPKYVDLSDYAHGDLGNGVIWEITGGKLIISGSGEIPDYNDVNDIPWIKTVVKTPINNILVENGITKIGNNAFNGLVKVSNISLADSIISIGDNAFYNMPKLTGEIFLPLKLKNVGSKAFALESPGGLSLQFKCLDKIVLATDVRENRSEGVEDYIFYGYGNYGDYLGVDSDNETPLYNNNVTYEIVKNEDGADTYTMKLSGKGSIATFTYNGGYHQIQFNHMPDNVLEYRERVTRVEIGEGITSLGYGSLAGFTNLQKVKLPTTIDKIGSNIFIHSFDSNLNDYVFSDGPSAGNITEIKMDIPAQIQYLGQYFGKYQGKGGSFEEIFIANPNIKFGDPSGKFNPFADFDKTVTLVVSDEGRENNVKELAKKYNLGYKDLSDPNFFENQVSGNIKYSLSSGILTIEPNGKVVGDVTVPSNLAQAPRAFDPKIINKIVIKSGVTIIDSQAFSGYENLEEVVLPKTLKKINDNAFEVTESNVKLKINIPKITIISNNIFNNRINANMDITVNTKTCNDILVTEGYTPKFIDSLNVLLIGNSYSQDASNNSPMVTSRLYTMLKNAYPEKEVNLALCYSGGKTMAWHWNRAEKGLTGYAFNIINEENGKWTSVPGINTSLEALEYLDWDIVSLQPYGVEARGGQGGAHPSESDKYKYTLDESLPNMIDFVAEHAPIAKQYLYMPWIETSDTSKLNSNANYYEDIVKTLIDKKYHGINGEDLTVIPVGTSIQNERNTYLALIKHNTGVDVTLANDPVLGLQRDGGHLSFNVGRYTAALTFALKITEPEAGYGSIENINTQIEKLTKSIPLNYQGTIALPQDYLDILKNAVANAILTPNKITDFGGTSDNVDPSKQSVNAIGTILDLEFPSTTSSVDATLVKGSVKTKIAEKLSTLKVKYPEITIGDFTPILNTEESSYTANVPVTFGYMTEIASISGSYSILPREITGISVNKQPNKMVYNEGEKLDLTGLEIKITYDSNETELISYNEPNLSFSIANDTVLEKSNNGAIIKASYEGFEASLAKITVNHILTLVEKVEPTCLKEGTKAYYKCSVCGDLFTDVNGTTPTTLAELKIDKLAHEMTHHEKVEPTCLEDGVKEYWACSLCGKNYSDVSGTTELDNLAIPAIGHSWNDVVYTWTLVDEKWTCEAKRVCKNDSKHFQTDTAVITSEITKEPSFTEKGITTYTAKFSEAWAKTQTKAVDDIDKKIYIAPKPNKITLDSSIENGVVTLNKAEAFVGDKIIINIKPNEGYSLDKVWAKDSQGYNIGLNIKNGEYSFTMPNSYVTVYGTFKLGADESETESENKENKFIDVPNDSWYAKAIEYVTDKGLMEGTSKNTFEPEAVTNRGMIVTILYRLEGEPIVTSENKFNDVESGSWFENAIKWASEIGIVKGYSDVIFAPTDNITREQMATILYRYAIYKGYNVENNNSLDRFNDVSTIDQWAEKGLQWANANGLIKGTSVTMISPLDNAIRGQVATIFMRFLEDVVK